MDVSEDRQPPDGKLRSLYIVYVRSLGLILLGMCRFAGCHFHRQSHKLDVPLPLLPLTWFPPIILDTISAALTAFQQVQAIVLEPDAESF